MWTLFCSIARRTWASTVEEKFFYSFLKGKEWRSSLPRQSANLGLWEISSRSNESYFNTVHKDFWPDFKGDLLYMEASSEKDKSSQINPLLKSLKQEQKLLYFLKSTL